MKTIHKYKLDVETTLPLPVDAEYLCVHEQDGHVCLWVLLDPTMMTIDCNFLVVGTGHEVPDGTNYIGTAHLHGGSLVLHVFQVNDPNY